MNKHRYLVLALVVLLVAAALAFLVRPAPIPVQTVAVQQGYLQETVEEEGKTRMHDHFVVAATVTGSLRRIPLHAGDTVRAGETLTWIDPAPIDPRQHAVLSARLDAARAARQQADALAAKAATDKAQTQRDLQRARELYRQGIVSAEALEKITAQDEAVERQLHAAQSGAASAAYQVEEAQSALLVSASGNPDMPTAVLCPVDGRVLRMIEQSERVVAAGTPLIEIAYTPRLEIVADFLTRDAVRIRPGMAAEITDWGGSQTIPATVRTVEPGGFTKVSALGVEEQRVNVLCDFAGKTDALEDGYHVEVRVIVWQSDSVLRVPSSAVFRSASQWAAFVVRNGRAQHTPVQIGHRGETEWEVLSGLKAGDRVIVHPSTEVANNVKVEEAPAP